ncbi:MAG: DUF1579 family protein [Planctomycetota bacterium]
MHSLASHIGTGLLCTTIFAGVSLNFSSLQDPQDPKKSSSASEMAAMMQAAQRYTQPGEAHKALSRFLGTWESVTRIMGVPGPGEKGTVEYSWLMEGRWIQSRAKGSMMGVPMETFMILGYDNFKQSYVWANVSNMDTALRHAEGDMNQDGTALITYGTLDEYLTGEHDKMVRTVWRFLSEDKILVEIHDFAIGEENSKVVEIEMTRS